MLENSTTEVSRDALAIVCGEDLCACGDYRKQHEFSGSCAVCRDVPAPWNGCKRFRFASRSHDHDGARCQADV